MSGLMRGAWPWVAAILTWVVPGLGQAYAGSLGRAAWICLAVTAAGILLRRLAVLGAELSFLGLVAAILIPLVVRLCVMLDAMRMARLSAEVSWRPRWSLLVAVALAYMIAIVPLAPMLVHAFAIPSASMIPTLVPGDYVYFDMSAYGIRDPYLNIRLWPAGEASPRRGDIAVMCKDDGSTVVARIVGLPGEQIAIRDKQVFIDGAALDEPYAVHSDATINPSNARDQMAAMDIPAGQVFVMGDHRDRSYDSRYHGTVPVDALRGRTGTVYFSWDSDQSRIRWERIGYAPASAGGAP